MAEMTSYPAFEAPCMPDAPAPLLTRAAGYWLLLLLPALSALVYLLYASSVDLEWLHLQYGSPYLNAATMQQLAAHLAAKDVWWQFGKLGLWPTILLCIEVLTIGVCCMGLGQLFGTDVKLRQLFLLGIWSKATYLLTATAIIVNMLIQDAPMHLLTTALDPLSWNNLLHMQGDGAIQFLTCNQGPVSLLGIGIVAYGFRQLSGRSWLQNGLFGALPYALYLASQYYLFGVVFK
jgi:hypothetical protein